jgi:ribonuclease E
VKKKILINARYPEEKRIAIVEGDRLVDLYVEVATREHLKGNIYKGFVAKTEPSLQAAFVDFGARKHGFLQLRELTPEYLGAKSKGRKKKIQDVLSKGQELVVQVERDERDTKGASLTTFISLPGRYVVMMPGQQRVGISRKIEDKKDRARLKEILGTLKLPEKTGFILRTAGIDKTAEDIASDLKYLTKLWDRIQKDAQGTQAPALIYKEHDIAVRTVRDYLTSDVAEVLADDQEAFRNVKAFLRRTLPWRKINVRLYKDRKPIFATHNIEEQIAKVNDRYVHLPSKGYLVFDKTEALTAIDVNSGRSRKEKNIEQTALGTNLEAADEIARQLRLRDIGGLIVVDFIDMESAKNRRQVEERLKAALSADKAHADISAISRFGHRLRKDRRDARPLGVQGHPDEGLPRRGEGHHVPPAGGVREPPLQYEDGGPGCHGKDLQGQDKRPVGPLGAAGPLRHGGGEGRAQGRQADRGGDREVGPAGDLPPRGARPRILYNVKNRGPSPPLILWHRHLFHIENAVRPTGTRQA